MAPRTLTPQQQRFVDAYLVDLDAPGAAVKAGYSARTATSQGYQLLHNPKIAAAVAAGTAAQQKRTGITADVVLGELLRIARVDLAQAFDAKTGKLLPIRDMPEDLRRAISGIDVAADGTTKVRFHSKDRALELLGKHLRLYTDRVEHSAVHGLADLLQRARARVRSGT